MTVRVLMVDDQEVFRAGLRTLIATQDDLVLVGEAPDGHEALRIAAAARPDVALMDLKMPILDGVATTRRLRLLLPDCRVVALTTFEDDELVFEALRAGAIGYLLKDAPAERIYEAIRAAARGESVLQPSVAAKLLHELNRGGRRPPPGEEPLLSERELQVLRLLGRGAANKEIATALFITEGTVKNHVTKILIKLKVGDRTQAALRARELGIL